MGISFCHPDLSKVISRTRLDGNLVWYAPSFLLIRIFQLITFVGPSDDCYWYSCAVLSAVCGISRRTRELRWNAEYAECDAVNLVLVMHLIPHKVYATHYLASSLALAWVQNILAGRSQRLSNRKNLELAKKPRIDGSPLLLVRHKSYPSFQVSLKALS